MRNDGKYDILRENDYKFYVCGIILHDRGKMANFWRFIMGFDRNLHLYCIVFGESLWLFKFKFL
jgi:hypothetical protein